ncbi:MAG TPA: response regulator [Pseudoduganella sp.]
MDTFSMIHDARILIVGGTDSDAGALEPMLRDAGYTSIALANDHLGARELHNKNRYDLVLVDLDAPSLDGSQLMYELRGLAPDACPPVVVLAEQQCRRMRAIQ